MLYVSCALLGFYLLNSWVLANSEKSNPIGMNDEIICSTSDNTDCYPRLFRPTKDFQTIKEGQDIPPGLHVRLDIYSGVREARLNIPMEGVDVESIELYPSEQAVVVIEQPDNHEQIQETVQSNATTRDEAPSNDAQPSFEAGTLAESMAWLSMEEASFDRALDDLTDLSHDMYHGIEIVKNEPVLGKLVCLMLGRGSSKFPANEEKRDYKAASILLSATQNNPEALAEVSRLSRSVVYPQCEAGQAGSSIKGTRDFVSIFGGRLAKEKDPQTLKMKIIATGSLLREEQFRKSFIAHGGMELLLAIWLKKGEQWDGLRRKVAQIIMDNFLDESMGARLGDFPKQAEVSTESCESKGHILEDECWEFHVETFEQANPDAPWAQEFLEALRLQRSHLKHVVRDREL